MQYYYIDADYHASQSNGSLIKISNLGHITGFLQSDPTSISFKELVNHNALLETKLKKIMAIVESFQSSLTFSTQPSH